jgi:hypothetical protein
MTNDEHNQIHEMIRNEVRNLRDDLGILERKIDKINENICNVKIDVDRKNYKLMLVIVVLATLTGNIEHIIKLFA